MRADGPDIIISGDRGIVANVEIQNEAGWSRETAREYIRNLYSDSPPPASQFFLLISQDKGFLWRLDSTSRFTEQLPLEINLEPIFRRFVEPYNGSRRLQVTSLLPLVFDWLGRLALERSDADDPAPGVPEWQDFLQAIGDRPFLSMLVA
jgi:hypothetical protein